MDPRFAGMTRVVKLNGANLLRLLFKAVDVIEQFLLRGFVDHRPDIGGEQCGVADAQLLHRPFEHGDDFIGRGSWQIQNAQSRATLTGGTKGAGDDVVHHLLRKCRAIDDQGVLAAGLGDQRNNRAFLVSERNIDRAARGS